jgi:hypothetical protein
MGVYLYAVPLEQGGTLVILDTEGTAIGDDSKTTHFCVLAYLLSSTVLFNTMRDFNNHSFNQLGAITGVEQCLQDLEMVGFFHYFIFPCHHQWDPV